MPVRRVTPPEQSIVHLQKNSKKFTNACPGQKKTGDQTDLCVNRDLRDYRREGGK